MNKRFYNIISSIITLIFLAYSPTYNVSEISTILYNGLHIYMLIHGALCSFHIKVSVQVFPQQPVSEQVSRASAYYTHLNLENIKELNMLNVLHIC